MRKAGGLVKLLALAPGHRLHREQVMNLLWPNHEAAANNLYRTLHFVRRVLEACPLPCWPWLQRQSPAKAAFPGTNGRIAFYSDLDGTISENLASSSTSDYDPAYSADGKKIAFVSERDGSSEIYRMSSAGRSQTRLTYYTANDVVPSWQPA